MSSTTTERDLRAESVAPEGRKYLYDFDRRMYDYALRTFAPHIASGSALEVGCYGGEFTLKLANLFADLTALDAVFQPLEASGLFDKSRVKFVWEKIEDVDFGGKTFDNIFLMHTLEHVDDPQAVLAKLKSLLALQGRLFVLVPNAQALSRRVAVVRGLLPNASFVPTWEAKVGHRRVYDLESLMTEVAQAGLREVDSGGVFVKPLCNAQFDKAMERQDIVDEAYMEACYQLSEALARLCASVYVVAGKHYAH